MRLPEPINDGLPVRQLLFGDLGRLVHGSYFSSSGLFAGASAASAGTAAGGFHSGRWHAPSLRPRLSIKALGQGLGTCPIIHTFALFLNRSCYWGGLLSALCKNLQKVLQGSLRNLHNILTSLDITKNSECLGLGSIKQPGFPLGGLAVCNGAMLPVSAGRARPCSRPGTLRGRAPRTGGRASGTPLG